MGVLKSTVQYRKLGQILLKARITGTIDDECFVDNKRRVDLPPMWENLEHYRKWYSHFYRRDYWQDRPLRFEVWLEKDTTSFLVEAITKKWGVPLRVSTGYFSRRFLYQAAKEIAHQINPIYIAYIGDFDPSGLDIERSAKEGTTTNGRRREGLLEILQRQFGWTTSRFEAQITWRRLGITEDDFYSLPETAKVPIKQDGWDENGDAKRGDPSLGCPHGTECFRGYVGSRELDRGRIYSAIAGWN
jgi:hypothetical protein